MALFADETGFFDEEESRALLELSANISFALVHMEKEQELQASELRFRQLAENIREVFWLTDPAKRKILYVSPGYEEIWGRTCESAVRLAARVDRGHPPGRSRARPRGRAERAGERPLRRGVQDRPAGRLDPLDPRPRLPGVSQRHRGLPDHRHRRRHHREKAGRAGAARKRAPAQRHAGQRRDGLDDARPLGPHHLRQRLPAAAHRLATRGRHRQGLDRALHPGRDRAAGASSRRCSTTIRGSWHHENEILTRSGERRLIRWHNSVRRSADGEVVGTASIGEDITEKKLAEREILSLNANLEQRVADRTADLERARARRTRPTRPSRASSPP